jgi:hypothetical protein
MAYAKQFTTCILVVLTVIGLIGFVTSLRDGCATAYQQRRIHPVAVYEGGGYSNYTYFMITRYSELFGCFKK